MCYLTRINNRQKIYLRLSSISTQVDLENAVLHRARDNNLELVRIRNEETHTVDAHLSHPF
ncbi:hypothetical protein FMO003_26740 [Moritella sp. F3]|nr:hypothetical protein FMO001_26450 [Moritella sp. F1]GIC82393.1 hypothetical protein FMO003_26740 [Moritella sp. F3]